MHSDLERLIDIMARLRDPENGCPWDLGQSFETIAPYTIEEAYEVADAIERGDMPGLREELGDLLLQVVFHSRMAEEENLFTFGDVASAIADKMIRRHPHIFGDTGGEDLHASWETHKAAERDRKAAEAGRTAGILDDVPRALPALTRAEKLQNRAAREGFDWPTVAPVLAKVDEELAELRAEIDAGAQDQRLCDELGDLLFSCVNLARHIGIDPETALRGTNARFEWRFRWIEAALAAQGQHPADVGLDELERLWDAAKQAKNATSN